MGSILSEPVTSKKTDKGETTDILYASTSMQGWRVSMEDAHTTLPQLLNVPNTRVGYFAVYDGHGGDRAAKIIGDRLHFKISESAAFQKEQYKDALIEGFLNMDAELLKDPGMQNDFSGCTAVVCLLTPNHVFVGNAGDSRAVLSSKGNAIPLSFDHKPTDALEKERIEAAGGFVEYGRVNGSLALSRAFGDFQYKENAQLDAAKQIVTVFPDVIDKELSKEDEFIIIACDGIWDCMSNQQAVDFVRSRIANGKELDAICEELCDHCLAAEASGGIVGCDNMTVVIIGLLHGSPKAAWIKKCTEISSNTMTVETTKTPSTVTPNKTDLLSSSAVPVATSQPTTESIEEAT